MNMCSGSRTWHRIMKRNEGYALASQIIHERLPFTAVRAQGDIHRVAMIEPQMIVNCRLTEGTDGKRVIEPRCKKHLHLGSVRQRPMGRAVVADQRRCGLIGSQSHWPELFDLSLAARFSDQ